MQKYFFPFCKMALCITNMVVKQCSTEGGICEIIIEVGGTVHSFNSGESSAYPSVWHKKGCPCSTASFIQCCRKVVPRMKMNGGVQGGEICYHHLQSWLWYFFFPVINYCEFERCADFPSQAWSCLVGK